MRVVFYTHPHLLEPALLLTREMSRLTEFHLVLEMSPDAWSACFSATPTRRTGGVMPADPILGPCVPSTIRRYWQEAASFSLVVYPHRRALHWSSLPVSRAAARFLGGLRPDLLHVDDVSLRLALAYRALPRIDWLSVHDPEVHGGEENWRRDVARWLTFKKARRFVLHNRAQVEPFCTRYRVNGERVGVSRLGVYSVFREWIAAPVSEEPLTVLFFGRTSRYKGLDVLYRAMPAVAARVPGVRLIVAGGRAFGYRPPDPPALPSGGRIDVIDRYVPPAELAVLMRRASVIVCPYTDATQSGVVLTAYAFGKPVIATRVGGLPEYVRDGETGVIVRPRDPGDLAAAIARVLADGELRRALAAGVERATAGDLSWAARARDLLRLYETVRS